MGYNTTTNLFDDMITAQEIRLGNYFNVPRADQSPFRVDLIEYACDGFAKVGMNVHKYENPFKKGELINGHPLTWELNELKGIELTEQILLDCGFRNGAQMLFLPIPNLACELHATLFHGQFVIEIQNHMVPLVTEVKYLHHLQNLYFSLTLKELPYKPSQS